MFCFGLVGYLFGTVDTKGHHMKKMESGAEAPQPQQQRRKPVMHGLEDQKKVSLEFKIKFFQSFAVHLIFFVLFAFALDIMLNCDIKMS